MSQTTTPPVKAFFNNLFAFGIAVIASLVAIPLTGWFAILLSPIIYFLVFIWLTRKFSIMVSVIQMVVLNIIQLLCTIGGVLIMVNNSEDSQGHSGPGALMLVGISLMFIPAPLLKTISDNWLGQKYPPRPSMLEDLDKSKNQPGNTIHNIMGDQVNIENVGIYTHNGPVTGNTVNQSNTLPADTDYAALANELQLFRKALVGMAKLPGHSAAITAVANAQLAAEDKNGGKVVSYLRSAGEWVWKQAKEIVPGIVAKIIKAHFGV
jgi:hypothetical protein